MASFLDTLVSSVGSGDPSKLFSNITIESAYGPLIDVPIEENPPPGMLNSVVRVLKPRITLHYKNNIAAPTIITPYGDPGETEWPVVGALLLAGGILISAFFIRGLTCAGCRSRKK